MKLHDLRPAEGSHKAKTRVGRGIAAGKGKTAGRGTKGQKARAGGSIAPWFEGGQTPLHQRIPKLRGFKNRFKIQYEVVNVGAIAAAAERGAFETDPHAKGKAAITINQDVLRAVGLVRTLNKPLKVLGDGELSTPLFVVADAFTATARTKIEAAGGSVTVLEVPDRPREALGVAPETEQAQADDSSEATPRPKRAKAKPEVESTEAAEAESTEATEAEPTAAEAKPARKSRAKAAAAEAPETETEAAPSADTAATAEPDVDTEQPETESPSGDDA
ncbi:MAG TPA: 50S ribosomal protein L15 [Candidatus Limnocylindrales bacterium]|nr:50S ribosomal protein L15 [Candidatus Limnocylindrales bacterium]